MLCYFLVASLPAKAFILESKIENGFGTFATVICTEGSLKQDDFFVCGNGGCRHHKYLNGDIEDKDHFPATPVFRCVHCGNRCISHHSCTSCFEQMSHTHNPHPISAHR